MKTKQSLLGILLLFAISTQLFLFNSCNEINPPEAIVTVIDENNQPVENASVTVLPPDNGRVVYLTNGDKYSETVLTNSSGEATFKFRYEAIYNVNVEKPKDATFRYNRFGKTVLILKDNETIQKSVLIRAVN